MILLLGNGTNQASGPGQHHDGHALGTVSFPISCTGPAQAEFNRAFALLHHMTYPQARQSFEKVVRLDPQCAMAHWGISMTLFQPLWPTRPGPAELRRGWEAVQRAKSLKPPTQRERLFIEAAEAFFLEPKSADYWKRIYRWEKSMEKFYAAFPQDTEAAAFYALAHLASVPPTRVSLSHQGRAANILLAIYEKNPDHPGAMHYLVHANDAPGRESESLEIVRRYEQLAPRNAHALHMPTHIYVRLGEWESVIRGNLKSADAALEELETVAKNANEELFARQIRVLRLELAAWLAHLNGGVKSSVEQMRRAADLEISTPKHAVTPGPTLPGYELLGDLLMEQKSPAEALSAYRRSLEFYPKRFSSLLGAARAARALNDKALALTFYHELLDLVAGSSRRPAVEEARSFLSDNSSRAMKEPVSVDRVPPNKDHPFGQMN